MQEVGREEGVNLEEWNGDQIESLFEYVFVFGNTVRESDRERKTTEKEGGRGNDEQDKIWRRIRPTAFSHPTKNMTKVMVGRWHGCISDGEEESNRAGCFQMQWFDRKKMNQLLCLWQCHCPCLCLSSFCLCLDGFKIHWFNRRQMNQLLCLCLC